MCILIAFCLVIAAAHASGEGTVESLSQYEYWDSGSIKKREVYDLRGYLRQKASYREDGSIVKAETFDGLGNKTEEIYYDHKGHLRYGIDGWAAMRWIYEDNRLVAQIAYDDTGKAIKRLLFSPSGRLIARQYRDEENIDPAEFINTIGIIQRNND
jgi:hypothetical protein